MISFAVCSSSPLQPGSHWVADSVSASRESHLSEDLSEPFPGVPLSSWLSSPTWEAVSWSVTGFSLLPPLPCPRLEDHGVPHKWLSPGLMSQCLHIQFSMFCKGFWKRSLYYIWNGRGHFERVFCPRLKSWSYCRVMLTIKAPKNTPCYARSALLITESYLWWLHSHGRFSHHNPIAVCNKHIMHIYLL